MHVNVLISDIDRVLFNELKPIFERESINPIYSSSIEESKKILLDKNIFLVMASCDVGDMEELIMASKADDLFRPIIILRAVDDCRARLLPMGVNAIYTTPPDLQEIATQSFNFITLYHAKRDSKSQNDVFKTLSMALEVRDYYTHGHGERVAVYATTLYDKLGFMDFENRELLRAGCIIHDVGKIGTPDGILKSDKKISDKEFEMIKNHPGEGVKICLKIISDPRVVDIIEHHHEKLDGSGYPHALKGDEISKLVQMTTISDVYDALTSDRSYRVKNTQEEAIDIMEREFVNNGKINGEYFNVFKNLLQDGSFENVKFI